MDVLIIGGSGNISYDFAAHLLEAGHRVATVTRGNGPVPAGCSPIHCDISDRPAFAAAVADLRPDCVVDFLCFDPDDARADYEVFRGKTGQFVFISSATVYEKPATRLPVVEDMPRGNPFSEYAQKKHAAEDYLMEVGGSDFPVTIVRPSHTYSRAWIPSPLNGSDFTVARRILDGRPILVHDDGQSLWTLTATTDFAVGLAGLLGRCDAMGEAFHITSDEPLSWNCIYQEIGAALGAEPEIVYMPAEFIRQAWAPAEAKLQGDKAQHAVFDNRKIKRFVPEFQCAKSFRQGVREAVAWLTADPARQKVSPDQDALIDDLIDKWREQA